MLPRCCLHSRLKAAPSPRPSILRVQSSLRSVHSLPSSIQEEDTGPGRDGLDFPTKEKSGVIADEAHALNNSQFTGPIVLLGAPMDSEERGTSRGDHAASGEDLDNLDTVDDIDAVDAAHMGEAAHELAQVAAERLSGVTRAPAAQSPRLSEDRKLDEFDTTGSV